MKLLQYFLLFILLFGYASEIRSQGFSVESNSATELSGKERFVSLDGRFSISLPKKVSGYNPQTVEAPKGRVESVTYDWKTTEGIFFVQFVDRIANGSSSPDKVALDILRNSILASSKAKLASETEISLQGYAGRELRLDFSDGSAITRIFVARNRVYQTTASLSAAKKSREPTALRVLDSFRLLTPSEVEAELKQKITEATPKPLPQEPVAKKLKSDAEDEGLKGKVKTLFTESEDLSGTWVVGRRKPSSRKYYNERGNLTKVESYDYRGNPFEITVYGYFDGDRVSTVKSINYEYNPPDIMVTTGPSQVKAKYDPRYTYKLKYKYDNQGRLGEELLYENNGKLLTRTVYSYRENQKEELVYDEKGALNQKSISTLDNNGNEIEEVVYDLSDNAIVDKYQYRREFGSQGNWMKQTTSKWVTKNGNSSFQPYSLDYRTITYY